MFPAWLRYAITAAILGFFALPPASVHAITGGVSVDEVLAARAGSRYTEQQVAFARAISASTVALFNGQGLCSATIVHPRVVLTAAHCVLNGQEVSRRIVVLFEGGASRRQALEVVVHPGALKQIRSGSSRPQSRNRHPSVNVDSSFMSADFALVLLHRPMPEAHAVVAPVPRGFRDSRAATKLIAGYGIVDGYQSLERLSLNFAELRGNSKLDEGAFSGESEIIMESRYRDGARVNVCSGDSGGPIFVIDRATSRLRQLAVTSAGDIHCREVAIFASIESQRAVLREMFDELMEGELGAEENPF